MPVIVVTSESESRMTPPCTLIDRLPTPDEYRALCESVGWGAVINFEAARTAIPNSLAGVVAVQDGQAVGMGRIVGDGAIFFYIQDIAVHPDHQGRGLGRAIMTRLMAYLAAHAPAKAFIGLFAAEGKGPFYEQFGFEQHPALTGMFTVAQGPPGDAG